MVATILEGNWDIPIGAPVYTADDQRLGYVVGGDADDLYISDGFLLRWTYTLALADVDHVADGDVVLLKLRMAECVARQDD